MDRRNFLASFGLAGYSLFVRLDGASAAERLRRRLSPWPGTDRADDRSRRGPAGTAHDAGRAGRRRAGRRRRPGRRLRGPGGGAQRGQGGAGAGPLAAGRQLVQRGQDARRRRQLPQGPARLARGRAHRRIPPRRRRQQPAALLGAVGPSPLRQGRQRAEHHPAARHDRLLGAEVKDGRIQARHGPLRQDRASVPHHGRSSICDCTGDSPARPGGRRRDARTATRPATSSASRWPRRPPTSETLGSSILFTARELRQADAVHAAEVGAQGHREATAVPPDRARGNTATGGSSGAASSTRSATTSASASSCWRS